MSLDVLPGATFVEGERRVLFSLQGFDQFAFSQAYDVFPGDEEFVMIRNLYRAEGEVIVVDHFFEELKAIVGN